MPHSEYLRAKDIAHGPGPARRDALACGAGERMFIKTRRSGETQSGGCFRRPMCGAMCGALHDRVFAARRMERPRSCRRLREVLATE